MIAVDLLDFVLWHRIDNMDNTTDNDSHFFYSHAAYRDMYLQWVFNIC